MSHDDHGVQLITFELAMAAKQKTKHFYSAHNIATRVFRHEAPVHNVDHNNVDRIFMGAFLRAILPMTVGLGARAIADNGEAKGLITPSPR